MSTKIQLPFKIPLWFKNKYAAVSAIFLFWLIFCDEYSIIERIKLSNELSRLKQLEKFYFEEYEANKERVENISGDVDELEKIAREKFFLKKKNEDVFVIEE